MEQSRKIPKGYRLKPETHIMIKKIQKMIKGNTDEALSFACRNLIKHLKNNKKGDIIMRIFILIFIIAISSNNVYSQWTLQQFTPSYNSVYMVPSTNIGFAVTPNEGIIRKTTDAGSTWNILSADTSETLNDVFFINQNTGWCVGNYGVVMLTTNGGLSFTFQTSGVTNSLNTIQFLDASTGYIAADAGKVLKTTNGGINWTTLTAAGSSLYGSFFLNPNTGWVGSFSGAVYWTTNGGSNWTSQTCTTASTIYDLHFVDNLTGWSCEYGGKIFKTTNSGTNWVQQTTSSTVLFDIFFYNANTGISCGGDKIYKTTNGGINWNGVFNNSNSIPSLLCISPIDVNNIIVVGDDGYIIKSSNNGNNWSVLYGSSAGIINSMWFTSTLNGFAVNSSGYLYKTSNGGANWNSTLTTLDGISNLTFANTSTGWISGFVYTDGGSAPAILKTTNGGTNWQPFALPGSYNTIEDMHFAGTNMGWLLALNGTDNSGTTTNLYITTNGGINWANPYNFSDYTRDLFFISVTEGWACGLNGRIYKTTNGGLNWSQQTNANTNDLNSIFFVSSTQGFACGESGTILTTTNGGVTWSALNSGITAYLYSIHFNNNLNGVCVGGQGNRLRTTNGGVNWINSPEPVSIEMHACFMVSPNNAYAGGEFGYISNLGGIVAIEPNQNIIPDGFSLSQNYPNPFNPATKIKFAIPGSLAAQIFLSVYDILGREVAVLVNEQLKPGNYAVDFDGSKLASGVYFYKLITDNFKSTKKMLLIK